MAPLRSWRPKGVGATDVDTGQVMPSNVPEVRKRAAARRRAWCGGVAVVVLVAVGIVAAAPGWYLPGQQQVLKAGVENSVNGRVVVVATDGSEAVLSVPSRDRQQQLRAGGSLAVSWWGRLTLVDVEPGDGAPGSGRVLVRWTPF